MKISAVLSCLTAVVVATLFSQASAETVQTAADVFDTRPFLWLEAENFASRASGLGGDYAGNGNVDASDYVVWRNGGPLQNEVDVTPEPGIVNAADYTAWAARFSDNTLNGGWTVVSKENPITSNQGLPILPATSNVSGTALLDQLGGGRDTVKYEVKFITAGTYQLYTRHSMFDRNGNGTVGDEDSVFLSPAFNKNSSTDWVGFEGLDYDEFDACCSPPTGGDAVDPAAFKPSTADSTADGWYALRDWGVKDKGVTNSTSDAATFSGKFNWYNRPFFVGALPAGNFASDFGFKTEYIVTEAMVGQTLTFEMSTREQYGVMDGFLFIQTSGIYPDMDLLDLYSQAEMDAAILPVPAGAAASLGAVPEPASLLLFLIGMAAFRGLRVRRSH